MLLSEITSSGWHTAYSCIDEEEEKKCFPFLRGRQLAESNSGKGKRGVVAVKSDWEEEEVNIFSANASHVTLRDLLVPLTICNGRLHVCGTIIVQMDKLGYCHRKELKVVDKHFL